VRDAWRAAQGALNPRDLVFLDETSTPLTLTPLRARAPRGQRAIGHIPRGHRPHIVWIATLTADGLGESLVVDGPLDGQVVAAFVEHVLVPRLRPGQTVVLDTLSVHKTAQARHLIEAAGCQVLFLPPYSPDLNPIEQAFAKGKQRLRRQRPRSWDEVNAAISALLPTITARDACAFFAAAGYPLP
jgi:transposase